MHCLVHSASQEVLATNITDYEDNTGEEMVCVYLLILGMEGKVSMCVHG